MDLRAIALEEIEVPLNALKRLVKSGSWDQDLHQQIFGRLDLAFRLGVIAYPEYLDLYSRMQRGSRFWET